MDGKRLLALAFLIGVFLTTGCGANISPKGQTESAKPEGPEQVKLYSDSSPFNQRIPPGAEVDPNSATMVRSLLADADEQGFLIALKKWTVPVYYADASTPHYDVRLTADWASARVMRGVPIPDFAAPDPEDDGEMAIIDTSTGCEYDFWQAEKRDGQWSASWANSIRVDSDGVYPLGLSARGSGFALLAGMIWPDELRSGQIHHALVFSYSFSKDGGPVPPATESDGPSSRSDAIPEGARIQLDPDLDLDSLSLTPYERTVAEALQEYGMILGDVGGGIELEGIHPMSATNNPYEGILPDEDYVYLPNIPIERFRVLKLPLQDPDPLIELIPSGCAEME